MKDYSKWIEITRGVFAIEHLATEYYEKIEKWCKSMERKADDFEIYLKLIGLEIPIFLGIGGPGFGIEGTNSEISLTNADISDEEYATITLMESYNKQTRYYITKNYRCYRKFWKDSEPKISLHYTYIKSYDTESTKEFEIYHDFHSYILSEHIDYSNYDRVIQLNICNKDAEGKWEMLAKKIYELGTNANIMELHKIAVECTEHPEYSYFLQKYEISRSGVLRNSTGRVWVENGIKIVKEDN